MKSSRKLQDSLENFRKALDKLASALKIVNDRELVVEGTIQRFEIVVELTWKTLRRALRYEGVYSVLPRDTMRAAFSAGWLHQEQLWQELLDRRNDTSHEYLDDQFILDYYADIKGLYPEIEKLLTF